MKCPCRQEIKGEKGCRVSKGAGTGLCRPFRESCVQGTLVSEKRDGGGRGFGVGLGGL